MISTRQGKIMIFRLAIGSSQSSGKKTPAARGVQLKTLARKIRIRHAMTNEGRVSPLIAMNRTMLSRSESGLYAESTPRGTPIINDPGVELVQAVIKEGFEVVPIPGPSAVTTALSVSAFSGKQFLSLGFLPNKKSERKTFLKKIENTEYTTVFFEAPHRIKQTLKELDNH